MMLVFLVLATLFLAYSNGANDNVKGAASLLGSHTTSYRPAIQQLVVAIPQPSSVIALISGTVQALVQRAAAL